MPTLRMVIGTMILVSGALAANAQKTASAVQTTQSVKLAEGRILIVDRQEVPYRPDPHDGSVIPPDHVYRYSIRLQTSAGTRVLWHNELNYYANIEAQGWPSLEVLDTSDEGSNIIIVFHHIDEVDANILRVGADPTKPPLVLSWRNSTLENHNGGLNQATGVPNPVVKSARIEGSYKRGTLAVRVTDVQMRRTALGTYERAPDTVTEFRLVGGKWVRGKTAELPPPPANPSPLAKP